MHQQAPHKENPAISWQDGVIGLHGLHWTPFQALRACWHACPTSQSTVPKFHPITTRRFHHSRTSKHSPGSARGPFPDDTSGGLITIAVTNKPEHVTTNTSVTNCPADNTGEAQKAYMSEESQSASHD